MRLLQRPHKRRNLQAKRLLAQLMLKQVKQMPLQAQVMPLLVLLFLLQKQVKLRHLPQVQVHLLIPQANLLRVPARVLQMLRRGQKEQMRK